MLEFDYVIVGAGSAGCVLANRLSADSSVSVCLLEAGPTDKKMAVQIPMGLHALMGHPKLNWNYYTTPQKNLNDRQIYQPRGKLLGGSSSVNAMVYIRGHRNDYDEWEQLGNPGWGYSQVLPYFKKSENQERGEDENHGTGGELNVCDLPDPVSATKTFVEAAIEQGYKSTSDFNNGDLEGIGIYQVTQLNGKRCSSARAFLYPALNRKNLTVITGAHCHKVLFEKNRAVGVEYSIDGKVEAISASKEVILSAGAIGSPQILMLSGVGPAKDLERLSIPIVCDLPGVGKNLQDHVDITVSYHAKAGFGLGLSVQFAPRFLKGLWDYFVGRKRRGILASNIVEGGGFIKTKPELDEVDVQLHFVSGNASADEGGHTINYGHAMSCAACVLKPKSRGSITLKSADPMEAPLIDTNFLDHDDDMETLVRGAQAAHRILNSQVLSPYRRSPLLPLKEPLSRSDFIDHIRSEAGTVYHPVGTCKMGPKSDPEAVVSSDLRVYGVEGLRVVDASIMPTLVRGNTNAPSIMIGEKGSDLIKGEAK